MTPEEIADAVAAGVAAAMAALPAPVAPIPRLLYSFEEAAEATGLPWTWFRDRSNAGEIPSVKVGRYRKISAAQLREIVEVCEVRPTSGPSLKAFKALYQRKGSSA